MMDFVIDLLHSRNVSKKSRTVEVVAKYANGPKLGTGKLVSAELNEFKKSKESSKNLVSFKEMISYLSKLKEQGEIDEKQFNDLILITCSNYIENEINLRIVNSLNDKIVYFINKL